MIHQVHSTSLWAAAGGCGLILVSVLSNSVGCSADADPTPSPTSMPVVTATPAPTPWPLQLAAGTYTLLAPYAFQVLPVGAAEPCVIQPAGEVIINEDQRLGTLEWTLYSSSTDFQTGNPACTYVQSIELEEDTSIYPSIACEQCQAYYSVHASPPATHDCPEEVLLALLDASGDGLLSEQELNPVDQWGFSPFDQETAPSAWTGLSSWCKMGTYLYCWGGQYVAWSRAWASASSAYTPMFALHPPIPEPTPASCPFGEGASPAGCEAQ